MDKILDGLIAIALGVGGSLALFWVLNWIVDRLPAQLREAVRPYVFVGPATLLVGVFLVYPAIRTVVDSFLDDRSESFVGLDNYRSLSEDASVRATLINNVLWVLLVPTVSVGLGLFVATIADRLPARKETFVKSTVFMPMAISAVGASTIWLFIYAWRPSGRDQIGVLNALWTGVGNEPVTWLQQSEFRLNTIMLIVIMLWSSTGFAMILLSAAIKAVPIETLEAASIDGASSRQLFWLVVVPQIKTTIAVVFTTISILVVRIFDVVFVMTGGNFDTDVIANRFVKELFDFRRFGHAAAIAVFLMVVTLPIIIMNIRGYRETREAV